MLDHSRIIAIIDDDEVFQLLTKTMLQQKKIADKILQFLNPVTGLCFFKRNAEDYYELPSIILLDLSMPEMTGWQFLAQLENINFTTGYEPAVFVISGSDKIDFEEMRKYRFIKGYIAKPVVMSKLISMIESSEVSH